MLRKFNTASLSWKGGAQMSFNQKYWFPREDERFSVRERRDLLIRAVRPYNKYGI